MSKEENILIVDDNLDYAEAIKTIETNLVTGNSGD